MREATIEAYLVTRVRNLGGEVRKMKWVNRRGAPDRLVMFPALGGWYVELKRPGEKLEDHQNREHTRLKEMGMRVLTIDSLDGVDKFMRERFRDVQMQRLNAVHKTP